MGVLQDKAAVVTGGSRGIGRGIVRRLARDGARVVFTYAADLQAAEEVEREVKEAGGAARAVRADLTEPDAAEQLMETAAEHLGGLDILVNNATPMIHLAPIAETATETFDTMLAGGARSVFLTMRYAARNMRDNGRVINISTINTLRPAPGNAPYAASKGAVEQLTQVAAAELGARGITVNTVSPGATDTGLLHATNTEENLALLTSVTPLRRLGLPEDIADVVAFLAGPDARWLTGQNIRAGGGL